MMHVCIIPKTSDLFACRGIYYRVEYHAAQKNPDVFELTRAKCNKIQAIPQQITDYQQPSFRLFETQIIKSCLFRPSRTKGLSAND